MSVVLPLFVCVVFALVAFWKKKLSLSGMLAAIFVGTSIFWGTGVYGFLLLGFFFISSNVVDRLYKVLFLSVAKKGRQKQESSNQKRSTPKSRSEVRSTHQKCNGQEYRNQDRSEEKGQAAKQIEDGFLGDVAEGNLVVRDVAQKGSRRDAYQVFANGGMAAFAALGYMLFADALWLIVLCASLAAATADTWASELGRWSKMAPRHILTKQEVEPGTSGAVTSLGTWASIWGALCIAVLSALLFIGEELGFIVGLACCIVFVSGWFGNWVDTYIGAVWQVLYRCPVCQRKTEKEFCHAPTQPFKGISWMNNDVVNTLCTVSAGGCAAIFTILLRILL